jgi:ribulose-5-phosphate 4-epimerase/fuculose-1-phosphate aldolase
MNDTTASAERQVRTDLAAAYRLIAHFGLDDGIYTHISARVPGSVGQFLINPYGMLFRDVTAWSKSISMEKLSAILITT